MTKRLFINGAAGRIGRGLTYEVHKSLFSNLELVGLNDPMGIDFAIESYKANDSVHGRYDWKIEKENDNLLVIDGIRRVAFFSERETSKIPFQDLGINILLEGSGFYGDPKVKDKSRKLLAEDNQSRVFLNYGIESVVQTYPAKTADASIIMGVNHLTYDPEKHKVISNASCTTKALALPLQVLINNGIEVEVLSMDTTHAATATQKVLESLGQIITHSTGAAKATGLVIPTLEGKMTGMSYRVPTLDGSFANLYFVATSKNELNSEIVNDMFREASQHPQYESRIGVFEGEDAGTFDIVGRRENSVVITSKTSLLPLSFAPEGRKAYLMTVISGYDNELGSVVDPVLLAEHIAEKFLKLQI